MVYRGLLLDFGKGSDDEIGDVMAAMDGSDAVLVATEEGAGSLPRGGRHLRILLGINGVSEGGEDVCRCHKPDE